MSVSNNTEAKGKEGQARDLLLEQGSAGSLSGKPLVKAATERKAEAGQGRDVAGKSAKAAASRSALAPPGLPLAPSASPTEAVELPGGGQRVQTAAIQDNSIVSNTPDIELQLVAEAKVEGNAHFLGTSMTKKESMSRDDDDVQTLQDLAIHGDEHAGAQDGEQCNIELAQQINWGWVGAANPAEDRARTGIVSKGQPKLDQNTFETLLRVVQQDKDKQGSVAVRPVSSNPTASVHSHERRRSSDKSKATGDGKLHSRSALGESAHREDGKQATARTPIKYLDKRHSVDLPYLVVHERHSDPRTRDAKRSLDDKGKVLGNAAAKKTAVQSPTKRSAGTSTRSQSGDKGEVARARGTPVSSRPVTEDAKHGAPAKTGHKLAPKRVMATSFPSDQTKRPTDYPGGSAKPSSTPNNSQANERTAIASQGVKRSREPDQVMVQAQAKKAPRSGSSSAESVQPHQDQLPTIGAQPTAVRALDDAGSGFGSSTKQLGGSKDAAASAVQSMDTTIGTHISADKAANSDSVSKGNAAEFGQQGRLEPMEQEEAPALKNGLVHDSQANGKHGDGTVQGQQHVPLNAQHLVVEDNVFDLLVPTKQPPVPRMRGVSSVGAANSAAQGANQEMSLLTKSQVPTKLPNVDSRSVASSPENVKDVRNFDDAVGKPRKHELIPAPPFKKPQSADDSNASASNKLARPPTSNEDQEAEIMQGPPPGFGPAELNNLERANVPNDIVSIPPCWFCRRAFDSGWEVCLHNLDPQHQRNLAWAHEQLYGTTIFGNKEINPNPPNALPDPSENQKCFTCVVSSPLKTQESLRGPSALSHYRSEQHLGQCFLYLHGHPDLVPAKVQECLPLIHRIFQALRSCTRILRQHKKPLPLPLVEDYKSQFAIYMDGATALRQAGVMPRGAPLG